MNSPVKCLFIPIVRKNITGEFIKKKFESLKIGVIEYVEFMDLKKKPGYKKAYLFFEKFYSNPCCLNLLKKVMDETLNARVVYDDPHYWIILENRNPEKSLFLAHKKIDFLEERIIYLENKIINLNNHATIHMPQPTYSLENIPRCASDSRALDANSHSLYSKDPYEFFRPLNI